jgi:hypothetical protein
MAYFLPEGLTNPESHEALVERILAERKALVAAVSANRTPKTYPDAIADGIPLELLEELKKDKRKFGVARQTIDNEEL